MGGGLGLQTVLSTVCTLFKPVLPLRGAAEIPLPV